MSDQKEGWRHAAEKGYLSSWLPLKRNSKRKLEFHGAFLEQVAESLIIRHTSKGDWVWDPMAGSGTTAVAATALEREVFLSDLSPITAFERLSRRLIWQADARTAQVGGRYIGLDDEHGGRMVPSLEQDTTTGRFLFDLVILHPPYHNIISFSDKESDLSNCASVTGFLYEFWRVCKNVGQHLKPGGYLAVVMGDIWEDAQVVPLGYYCLNNVMTALGKGARLKAIVVKNIEGNRHNAHRRNLLLSRLFRWGGVEFNHEYIYSIQKGK